MSQDLEARITGYAILLGIFFAYIFISVIIRSRALVNLDWIRSSIWLIPIVLLIFSLFKLPYGYYQFSKIVIDVAAIYIMLFEFNLNKKITAWTIVFLLITILFNPLIPIQIEKDLWVTFDLLTALVFIFHLGLKIKEKQIMND